MLSRGVDVGFPSEIVISLVFFIIFSFLNAYLQESPKIGILKKVQKGSGSGSFRGSNKPRGGKSSRCRGKKPQPQSQQ